MERGSRWEVKVEAKLLKGFHVSWESGERGGVGGPSFGMEEGSKGKPFVRFGSGG